MTQYFDRQEIRAPRSREAAHMRDLRAILAMAKPRSPALRRQIKGIDIATLRTRADLAQIPLLRARNFLNLQDEDPPFGGFAAPRLGALKRLIVCAGSRYEPEGQARDWWGAARGLCAAGFGRNDIVLNCFSYHLGAEGFMMESGASALGCAVIPAGPDDPDRQLEVIHVLRPTAFCGRLDVLVSLIERARQRNRKITSIKRGLVVDTLVSSRQRCEFESEGLCIRQAYCVPHLGIVAYESEDEEGKLNDGLIVNEGLILEIVAPDTGEPVNAGEIGEVVVTRLNPDYPLLRFATGHLSALLPGMSPCGRTNVRLTGILGPVAQDEQIAPSRMSA